MKIEGYYARVCDCTVDTQCISDSIFHGKCKACETFYRSALIVYDDKRVKPNTVINAAQAELESANFHSVSDLPNALWTKLKPLVASSLHHDLAWAIATSMPS